MPHEAGDFTIISDKSTPEQTIQKLEVQSKFICTSSLSSVLPINSLCWKVCYYLQHRTKQIWLCLICLSLSKLQAYLVQFQVKPMHSGLNGGHEQKFMVLKINEIILISLPHTQDIMFQKNLGQIFPSRVQEVALKMLYEAENIHMIFAYCQNDSC